LFFSLLTVIVPLVLSQKHGKHSCSLFTKIENKLENGNTVDLSCSSQKENIDPKMLQFFLSRDREKSKEKRIKEEQDRDERPMKEKERKTEVK